MLNVSTGFNGCLIFGWGCGLCGALVYLHVFFCSCCLAGRAYPLGDIPEDLVVQVKHQVCR